jgi:hypothetical protein
MRSLDRQFLVKAVLNTVVQAFRSSPELKK